MTAPADLTPEQAAILALCDRLETVEKQALLVRIDRLSRRIDALEAALSRQVVLPMRPPVAARGRLAGSNGGGRR